MDKNSYKTVPMLFMAGHENSFLALNSLDRAGKKCVTGKMSSEGESKDSKANIVPESQSLEIDIASLEIKDNKPSPRRSLQSNYGPHLNVWKR